MATSPHLRLYNVMGRRLILLKMIVSELITKLQALPQEKNVVLCDLQNDGDGDGLANLYEIVSVEEETALQKGKKKDVVFICYNE